MGPDCHHTTPYTEVAGPRPLPVKAAGLQEETVLMQRTFSNKISKILLFISAVQRFKTLIYAC